MICPKGYTMGPNGVCIDQYKKGGTITPKGLLRKPGSAVNVGDVTPVEHELDYSQAAICQDFMQMHSNCHANSGLSMHCWATNSCCQCVNTGYGQWTLEGAPIPGLVMTDEEGEEMEPLFNPGGLFGGNPGMQFQNICQCYTTCQMPSFCQGGYGGGGMGGSGVGGSTGTGRWAKGGPIRKRPIRKRGRRR